MLGGRGKPILALNETRYNPITWAEWAKQPGIIGDSTGLEFTANGASLIAFVPTTLKTSTNYGILYNVVSCNLSSSFYMGFANYAFAPLSLSKTVGSQKAVATSNATITNNRFNLYTHALNTVGTKIKVKDVRVFELPIGSLIESDFASKTADELNAKYNYANII